MIPMANLSFLRDLAEAELELGSVRRLLACGEVACAERGLLRLPQQLSCGDFNEG